MQAMDIANEALDSVLGNVKTALRISIPIFLFCFALAALMGFDFWKVFLSSQDKEQLSLIMQPRFSTLRVFIIPVIVLVGSMYWITVAWHRFIILGEQPRGILPKLHLGRIWAYIWRLMVLTIVIGLVGILPLAILSSAVGGGKVDVANYSEALAIGPIAVVMNALGTIVFAYAFMRYSPFLVAAAIGKPIWAASGRKATYWIRKDIFLLSIGYAVVTLLSTIVGAGVSVGILYIDLGITLGFHWIAFMFSISLITTLYQQSAEHHVGTEMALEEGDMP